MKPKGYKTTKDKTIFLYDLDTLENWFRGGFQHGNTGMILHSREKNLITYQGFGTIENPRKDVTTMTLVHNPIMDGELPDNDEIIKEKPEEDFKNTTYKFIMFDLSKDNKQE